MRSANLRGKEQNRQSRTLQDNAISKQDGRQRQESTQSGKAKGKQKGKGKPPNESGSSARTDYNQSAEG